MEAGGPRGVSSSTRSRDWHFGSYAVPPHLGRRTKREKKLVSVVDEKVDVTYFAGIKFSDEDGSPCRSELFIFAVLILMALETFKHYFSENVSDPNRVVSERGHGDFSKAGSRGQNSRKPLYMAFVSGHCSPGRFQSLSPVHTANGLLGRCRISSTSLSASKSRSIHNSRF
jgi:hypothetical protein